MGNCLQNLFRSHRSSLKHESLLNFKQLNTMIKSSTYNDNMFYSSANLTTIEQFLNQFTHKPQTAINPEFINQNIKILQQFTQNLRDRSSPVGKQFVNDQQRVYKYLQQQKLKGSSPQQAKLSDLVILRLQIQVLLLGISVCQFTQSNSEWDLVLQIYEDPTQCLRSTVKSTDYNVMEQLSSKFELIDRIIVRNQENGGQLSQKHNQIIIPQNSPPDFKKHLGQEPFFNARNQTISNINQNSPTKHKKMGSKQTYQKDVGELQQFRLFQFTSKVVNKHSKLNFNLFKIKKRKNEASNKHMSDTIQIGGKNKIKSTNPKNRILVGFTSLSVSDFIYYNSLMISDVIPLNSPSSTVIKSSITTTGSNMNSSNTVAFLSVRGQGLQAQTLQKDYLRIIKQHQLVVRQLQICLEGEKSWQKLSEFRQSSESHPNQSLYSDYSIPQQGAVRYKI